MFTLDPKKVQIDLGGIIPTAFADGTFIEITPDGDDFALYSGTGGSTSRAAQHNTSAVMKLTLQQTSPTNDQLSALRRTDVATSAATVPALVKDLSGTTTHAAKSAYIMKQPVQKYGREVDTIEWDIQLADYVGFIGGNIG